MEFEKNKKYFTVKNKVTTMILPIIIIVIGAILFLIVRRAAMIIPVVVCLAGIIWLIAGLTTGMKDDDIDAAVASVANTLEAHASENFKFPRRYEVLHPNVILGGFDFTREEETPIKRGSDLKYRNGWYCSVLLNFTNDGLRIDSRKFSILEDKKEEAMYHFKWEDVEGSKLEEKEINVKTITGEDAKIKVDVLHITMKDGTDLAYCVKNTADVDETIDMIYRQTVRVKQAELKAKAEAEANA
ncbi:MAG: hypothetical protein MJ175_06280 [Clostridia bacterium]|nr:hypothetical protein [Clostridia bacterium]